MKVTHKDHYPLSVCLFCSHTTNTFPALHATAIRLSGNINFYMLTSVYEVNAI